MRSSGYGLGPGELATGRRVYSMRDSEWFEIARSNQEHPRYAFQDDSGSMPGGWDRCSSPDGIWYSTLRRPLLISSHLQSLHSRATCTSQSGDAPYSASCDTYASAVTCPQGIKGKAGGIVLLVHGTGSTGPESWDSGPYTQILPNKGWARLRIVGLALLTPVSQDRIRRLLRDDAGQDHR